jgi:hypothetical protein
MELILISLFCFSVVAAAIGVANGILVEILFGVLRHFRRGAERPTTPRVVEMK